MALNTKQQEKIWLVLQVFAIILHLYKFKIYDSISCNKKLVILIILSQGFT